MRRLTDALDPGEITRLEVYSIGVYQPMFKRAYNGNYPEELGDMVAEATNDFRDFTNSTLYGVAAEILELDEEHIESFIENGWEEPRLRFILETQVTTPQGGRTAILHTVITGYLDSVDALNESTGDLAEDTEFTVNNVVQYVTEVDGSKATRRYVGKSVNPISSTGNSDRNDASVIRQTNRNMIDAYQFSDIAEELGGDEVYSVGMMDKDSRLTASSQYIPAEYVKDSVTALRIAQHNVTSGSSTNQYNFEDTTDDIIEQAKGLLDEDRKLTSVGILNSLSIDNPDFISLGSFQYRDLLGIYDGIDDVLNINIIYADELSSAEDSEVLDNSPEAEIALHLAMIVPAVCFEYLMGVVEIDIDTDHHEEVAVTSSRPILPDYADIGTEELFVDFISIMIRRTLESWVSRYGSVLVRASIDALGESVITVSLDGLNDREYIIPQFADNSFSPLLSSDYSTVNAISSALADISADVYEAKYTDSSPLR